MRLWLLKALWVWRWNGCLVAGHLCLDRLMQVCDRCGYWCPANDKDRRPNAPAHRLASLLAFDRWLAARRAERNLGPGYAGGPKEPWWWRHGWRWVLTWRYEILPNLPCREMRPTERTLERMMGHRG